jgi:hypothetical protein
MFMSSGRMLGFIATLLTCSVASPQSDKSLPGCEPPRELRIAIREQLDPKKFQGMKTYERMARRVEIIQSLMEKFPREVYSAHDLIWYAWYGDLDLLPALQQSLNARKRQTQVTRWRSIGPDTRVSGTTRRKPFERSSRPGIWPRIFPGHILGSQGSTGEVRPGILRR